MRIVIFGLTVSPSWGNGHATLWRGLLPEAAPRAVKVFYGLDTPVTLDKLQGGQDVPYIGKRRLRDFDLVLSYTAGPTLTQLQELLGARRVATLYGHADPEVHRRVAPRANYACALSYLGTYAADRQAALEELFIEPARRLPHSELLIGGAQYPADFPWTTNIRFVRHMPPAELRAGPRDRGGAPRRSQHRRTRDERRRTGRDGAGSARARAVGPHLQAARCAARTAAGTPSAAASRARRSSKACARWATGSRTWTCMACAPRPRTSSPTSPASKWSRFAHVLPQDLGSKSVQDIGCNAGFHSLEMKRRGAARVLPGAPEGVRAVHPAAAR